MSSTLTVQLNTKVTESDFIELLNRLSPTATIQNISTELEQKLYLVETNCADCNLANLFQSLFTNPKILKVTISKRNNK